jgi:excinuclease ABC subunit A
MDFLPTTWVLCESCQGKRYQASVLDITYNGLSIADVLELSIADAADFFATHVRLAHALRLLADMGLGYLTLGQASPTLSGGEAQRLKLVTEIAKGRVDMKRLSNRSLAQQRNLYLIEEPSVGLHTENVRRLIDVLHRLVDEGHTAVVIEHHMLVAAAADWIIDLGPEAGAAGGRVVAQGLPAEVAYAPESRTAPFLGAEMRRHRAFQKE